MGGKMNVLFLAPHADDVEMGCGVTVAKFSEEFIRGLIAVRGSQVDVKYAEAFGVLRWML